VDPSALGNNSGPGDNTSHVMSPYVYVRKTRLYTQVLPKNSVPVTQKIEHRVNYFTDSCDKRDKTLDGL